MKTSLHSYRKSVIDHRLITSGVRTIGDFEQKIIKEYNTDQTRANRGWAFEAFTEAYLNVIRKADEVYPDGSIPHLLRKSLKLTGKDLGVDGIFKENGKWHAYQCKFRGNRSPIPFDEISTFFASSEHCANRFVITNSNGIGNNAKHIERVSTIGHNELEKLTKADFVLIRKYLEGKKVVRKPVKPRPHQMEGIRKSRIYFQKWDRGQLIWACATGKTLGSVFIAKKLRTRSNVVFVPSLLLATQFRDDWFFSNDMFVKNMKFVFVASDKDLGKMDQYSDISFPVTTDPKELNKIIKTFEKNGDKYLIISTYQSAQVTCKALKGITIDFGIYDEAHVTSSRIGSAFAHPIFDRNIKIAKRLFMTATPRIIKARNGDEAHVTSMDNEELYGKTIDTITFKKAKELGLITDIEPIIIVIDKNLDRAEIDKC